MHYAIIYPYLVGILETYLFDKTNTDVIHIKKFSDLLFSDGIKTRNYEQSCYAVYFALKYDFELNDLDAKIIIESDSCILKLLGFLYFKKQDDKSNVEKIHQHALEMKNLDMERYWVFLYEVLNVNELDDDWRLLKKKNISFIRQEYTY